MEHKPPHGMRDPALNTAAPHLVGYALVHEHHDGRRAHDGEHEVGGGEQRAKHEAEAELGHVLR